jgi:hypothetical protein
LFWQTIRNRAEADSDHSDRNVRNETIYLRPGASGVKSNAGEEAAMKIFIATIILPSVLL